MCEQCRSSSASSFSPDCGTHRPWRLLPSGCTRGGCWGPHPRCSHPLLLQTRPVCMHDNVYTSAMQVIIGASLSENMQTSHAGRHAQYVDVRTDAPTGTVSCYIMLACMYFPSHHRTWLQHYDSNAPLLGHLVRWEDRQQIEDDIAICMYIHVHGWPQLHVGLLT